MRYGSCIGHQADARRVSTQSLRDAMTPGWHRLRAHRTSERLGIRRIRSGDLAHGPAGAVSPRANADLAEGDDRIDNRDAVKGCRLLA
jgi:hypothetical protein